MEHCVVVIVVASPCVYERSFFPCASLTLFHCHMLASGMPPRRSKRSERHSIANPKRDHATHQPTTTTTHRAFHTHHHTHQPRQHPTIVTMAAREKGGRVVFIGNIPYGVSEEQICEIFGRVGSVVNFRLVYDKETQRPKGFGFLEYTDVDAAASAVRNLNDFEIMGQDVEGGL